MSVSIYMKNLWRLTLIGFVLIICFYRTLAEDKPSHNRKIVCYYSTWSTYRQPYPFTPKEIDPSLCTHIMYSYVALKQDTQDAIVSYTPHTDLKDNYGLGYYSEMAGLKTRYPHLKILLCLGGWNQGSINFSKLAQSKSKRSNFISSVVSFLREYNFDGLDIFWQYPGQRGGSDDDKENFTLLLRELKEEFRKHNYILTVFLSSEQPIIVRGYNLSSIGQTVDWVNLYAHGYNTPWSKKFGINSPLDSKDGYNVKSVVNFYLANGVPNDKLVIILSSIGFGFSNTDKPGKAEGLSGLYNDDKGFTTFHEICRYLSDPDSGWKETWDTDTSTPIAIKGTDKISYDNQESIALKVKYAYEKNLTGAGIWTIDTDDFLGLCSLPGYGNDKNQTHFPLVKAINKEFERLEGNVNHDTTAVESDIKVSVVIHEYK